jgi:hypothetical protein
MKQEKIALSQFFPQKDDFRLGIDKLKEAIQYLKSFPNS